MLDPSACKMRAKCAGILVYCTLQEKGGGGGPALIFSIKGGPTTIMYPPPPLPLLVCPCVGTFCIRMAFQPCILQSLPELHYSWRVHPTLIKFCAFIATHPPNDNSLREQSRSATSWLLEFSVSSWVSGSVLGYPKPLTISVCSKITANYCCYLQLSARVNTQYPLVLLLAANYVSVFFL